MTRFTLSYTAQGGLPVVLFNLARAAVAEIETAQEQMGSRDFTEAPQPHRYCQMECDVLRPGLEREQRARDSVRRVTSPREDV